MGKKTTETRLSKERIDEILIGLPISEKWSARVKALVELALTMVDTSQDLQALRGAAITCRQTAQELSNASKGKKTLAQQLATQALIEASKRLEEQALQFDVPRTTANQAAKKPANNVVSKEGDPPMESDRPTNPGGTTAPPKPAPSGNTTQLVGSIPPIVQTPDPGAVSHEEKSMSSDLAEEGLDPSLDTVDDDGLVEPLSADELRSMDAYLGMPIETWNQPVFSEAWKLCFPSNKDAGGRRSGCNEVLVKRYYEALKWRTQSIRRLATMDTLYGDTELKLIRQLLGHNQPSHRPNQFLVRSQIKKGEQDEAYFTYLIHVRWNAQRLLNHPKPWDDAVREWLTRYERDMPKTLVTALRERHDQEAANAALLKAKTVVIPTVGDGTLPRPPAPDQDEPPFSKPDHGPAPLDPAEAEDFRDVERPSVPPAQHEVILPEEPVNEPRANKRESKKPLLFGILAIGALFAAIYGVAGALTHNAARSGTDAGPSAPVAQPHVEPTPLVAVAPPAPPPIAAPAPPPPVVEQEILRDLRPTDVGVDDLTRVRDGQIPTSVRYEHLRCRPSPTRNPDGLTIDYSRCQWREVRPVSSQPTSSSTSVTEVLS